MVEFLVQDVDDQFSTDFKVVTEINQQNNKKSTLFAQRVVKYVKSNAIVVSNGIQAFRNWRRSSE